ncbi:hypothetical protein DSM112329_04412 [Paraconexibacter sp. AEG42_29]|uniref:Zinc ribbon domain-containing protein n=1 Tax=Paraconexibacter sp. AEG42_29 TaxID=2997339 RepID=A0AAU7B0U5_9ACTN
MSTVRPAPGAPTPQRLCPHCASVATTADSHCPWCRRSYRRRVLPAVALLLLVQTVLVLGVLITALAMTGDTVQTQVDDGIADIRKEIDDQVDDIDTQVRRELRRELDRRLPATAP